MDWAVHNSNLDGKKLSRLKRWQAMSRPPVRILPSANAVGNQFPPRLNRGLNFAAGLFGFHASHVFEESHT
jgi:hypothetical protein